MDHSPHRADTSEQYIAQQRDSFLNGVPPPDFPGGAGESEFVDRAKSTDVLGTSGRIGMGLSPVEIDGQNKNQAVLRREVNEILGFKDTNTADA